MSRSDLVLSLRRLAEAPGFVAVCVITLALGIGGNAAVFTLIDRVLLKPLPVERPWELYRLGDTDDCCVNSGLAGSFSLFSHDLYTRLRDAAVLGDVSALDALARVLAVAADSGQQALGAQIVRMTREFDFAALQDLAAALEQDERKTA